MVSNIVAALDDSGANDRIIKFARGLCRGHFKLHLVTVLRAITSATRLPAAGMGAYTFDDALPREDDPRHIAEVEKAQKRLDRGKQLCISLGIDSNQIVCHTLAPAGGASGAGGALVAFANNTVDRAVAVLGNRGLSNWKRSVMYMTGLGSVGTYCVHHMKCPVAIVKPRSDESPRSSVDNTCTTDEEDTQPQAQRTEIQGGPSWEAMKVCLCVDDSAESKGALKWIVNKLLTRTDFLHIVSVAVDATTMPLIDETAPTSTASTPRRSNEVTKISMTISEKQCARAAKAACDLGISSDRIVCKVLRPQGGVSNVTGAVKHYVQENEIDACVMGRHAYGSFRRGLMSLVGLASVSDDSVHHLPCTTIVYKLVDEQKLTRRHTDVCQSEVCRPNARDSMRRHSENATRMTGGEIV